MVTREAARIGERGIEGERRVGVRQVTLLARESWEAACKDLRTPLPWTTRRANLLVEGVPFVNSVGRWLRVGEAVLEVIEESAPCERMERLHPGLGATLVKDWRGGIACKVVIGGDVKVGDAVKYET
jgi:MOSC domain-containing protein YiiM